MRLGSDGRIQTPAIRADTLRIALLSALAEAPDRPGERLAHRRFAGRSVLAHQIDCCAALECDSVIVLARGLGQDLLVAQRHCERVGIRFQQIEAVGRLVNFVTAADEIVLMLDGVLPDRETAIAGLSLRSAILAFPAEQAIPLGFERIDSSRAWSGVLRTRGESVARLLDLPADIDMSSALLRITLQSGARIEDCPSELLADGRWQRTVDPASKGPLERRWLADHLQPARFTAPGLATAERAALRLAHDISGSGKERVPRITAMAAGLVALAAGLLGHPAIGLGAAAIGLIAVAIAAVFERVARIGSTVRTTPRLMAALGWAYDALILYLLSVASAEDLSWLRLFVPAVLLGVLRLGQVLGRPKWRASYADRIVLLALLLPFAAIGATAPACAVLSLLVMASLFHQPDPGELTGA